jgi:deoxyribodipyrimidine photolyase
MQLTEREKETYEKFTQYKRANPKAPKSNKKKPGPKPGSTNKPAKKKSLATMHTIAIPQEAPKNFAVIVCNQTNLQDVLNAIS